VLGWRDVVDALPTAWRESILAEEAERVDRQQRSSQQQLAVAADVSANERLVLKHLGTDAPRQIDALAARTRVGAGALAHALLSWELKGLAAALPGGFYVRRL